MCGDGTVTTGFDEKGEEGFFLVCGGLGIYLTSGLALFETSRMHSKEEFLPTLLKRKSTMSYAEIPSYLIRFDSSQPRRAITGDEGPKLWP